MGKRKKAKPLLAVQGIVHLTESFVQPSQESGLLTTVGGNEECRGLILAPNYGYAISASSLAKKSEEKEVQEEENVTNNDDGDGDKKADTENIENETPGTSKSEEAAKEELSVAELVRHIGGAKDKPLAKGDIVEDRPESERPQQTPKEVEQDDFETTEFYESLGISRPNQAKKPVVETLKISNENEIREGTKNVSEFVQSIPESIADYYKNYTQYYYSKPSDPYGSQPLEFSRPVPASEEADSEIDYSIIEIAIRVQKAKREHEAKKTELGKLKTNKTEEVETPYDPLPMEITPSENLKALPEDSNLATYWKYVEENPHDFHRWAYLISYTETTGLLNETRKVYSAFLPLFPYCFGYWKRYSDIEKGHSYLQRALMILQRGLEFIPLSVDLWISYLTLFAEINAHNKDFQELLREQYENGINNAGMEFRSDALWDSYIQWEINLQNRKRAFVLYKRLLQVPTRLYNRHWDNAKILIRDHHPRDFLSYDDYDAVRKKGCKALGFKYKAEPEIESGEIRKTIKPEDKLMAYIKERVLENLSKIQTKTQLEADKRWDFEDKVKRPYFHVKALDKSQLYNWENYLNFEIKEGNHDRVVLLFERCLIACANYERFWCKYARYLEKYHRFHPELNAVSTHLQPSKVNLEIVSTKEAVEEEELISSVREVLQSLVDAVMEAETLETIAVKNTMESILFTLDDPPDPVSVVKEVMQIILYQLEDEDARTIERLTSHHVNTDPSSEGSLVPGNLNGHSENTCSELPLNSGSNSNHSTSSDFSALMKIPDFPPAKYRWHEVVRDIYKRASLIHCARKPTVRLQWASFEEEIGNTAEARSLIGYVLDWYPMHLEAKLQLLDLERRNSEQAVLIELYDDFLAKAKGKDLISLISIKYARFLFKEACLPEKALTVLRNAIRRDSANHRLYSQVIEICYHKWPVDRKGTIAAIELALKAPKMAPEHKLLFARKRVHFYQEHADLERCRNALDDLYEIEAVMREREEAENRWREFEKRMEVQKAEEVARSLQPFPVPKIPSAKAPQDQVAIEFETGDIPADLIEGSTDVEPSVPYGAVPPVQEYLDPGYGYAGKHPDAKLAENLGHKQYESIEAKGYPETIKDTPEDLKLLRKRKNPLYIVPPKRSFYISTEDPDVPGAKRLKLEAPVLLSDLITPNSAPCVNVPDWFVKEGGELCLSETIHGFSIIRYWPHFLSDDGNIKMFKSIRKSVKWHQKQILTSYGTWRHVPRLISWLGPCEYSHTGLVMPKCEDWTSEILDLLHRLVQLVNHEFNSCSLNLYRTGHDSNAWHADIHPGLGSNPPIASVSLGALRTFEMKRKGINSSNFIRFPLFPGSLLIMEGATQADWLHQVPKEPTTKAERLNLTFRVMHALQDEDPDAPPKLPIEDNEKATETTEKDTKDEVKGTVEGSTLKKDVKKDEQIDPLLLPTFPPEKEKPKEIVKPWDIKTKFQFRN